jgi:hypothetical protein
MSKYLTNEQIVQYLFELRGKTMGHYRATTLGKDAPPAQ